MKLLRPYILILLAPVVLLPLASCRKGEARADWSTVTATRRDLSASVLATGTVKPEVGAEVRVGCRVSGIVERLHVGIGDRIDQGSLLAELDGSEHRALVAEAEAALANSRAELVLARSEVERARALASRELVPASELDQAEAALEVAASRVVQAEAQLESTRIQLGYTKIRAPISGVVASVSTQEGETVAASFASPTFVTIIDLERLELWAWVDETDIGRIREGQSALFTVDTYGGTEFEGSVKTVYPRAEIVDNVVNYVTIIEIGDRGGKVLRPEMTATVNILLETRQGVLTVPNRAVRREKGRKFVYVPGPAGPVKRRVRIGWKDGDHTEITEGLEEGTQVIVGDVPAGTDTGGMG